MFQHRKVGGIHFIRIGRCSFTFCLSKRHNALGRLVIEAAHSRVARTGKL